MPKPYAATSDGQALHALKKATEMQTSDFILGDRRLHQRLFLTTAILGKFVMREKAKYTSDYLAQELGCSIGLVQDLCAILKCNGFISKLHEDTPPDEWSLACDSAMMTLGDVFTAVAESSHLSEDEPMQTVENTGKIREAELLVSQAALDVNEFIYRHLKQFSLLSLKTHTGKPLFAAAVRTFA